LPRLDSAGFFTDVPSPPSLSGLSRPELEPLLVELFGKVAALEKVVGEQREEIARLKGPKGRPNIKPSGMDRATQPSKPTKKDKQRFPGKVTPRVSIEDQVIQAAVPPGSSFKGYEWFLVQDLVISVRATRYQRERWITPDGRTILAPLPEGIDGHFDPEVSRPNPLTALRAIGSLRDPIWSGSPPKAPYGAAFSRTNSSATPSF
jgi:hypothetical protein